MTSTMQMIKTPSQVDQWKSLFSNFTTLTGSRNFMKKLIAVSLSAITYIRGVFPDRAYGERHLSGLKLKILTEDIGIQGVEKFINLIKSCYEAIDNKYLYRLSIGFCTDVENKDEVVEAYHLNFRYNDSADEFSIENNSNLVVLTEKDPTVEATFVLLKNILSMKDILGPLPKKAYLTMKLLYNAEITPVKYVPYGFEPSDNHNFMFPPNAVKLALGDISTELHKYKLYVKTALSKEPLHHLMKKTVLSNSMKSGDNVSSLKTDEDCLPQTELGSKPSDIVKDSLTVKKPSVKVHCPCSCKQDTGTDILKCSGCDGNQHSICCGILNSEKNAAEYFRKGKEQQELCAFRRALVFCASVKQVTALQLERNLKCSKELSKDIIERLEAEGFVRKFGQKYTVNVSKITNYGYRKYISRQENKENMKIPKPMELLKKKRLYEEPDIEDASDSKGKQNLKKNSQSGFMDIDLEKIDDDDDSENAFQPLKKRCISARSPIVFE